jgi:hypothetical protein
VKLGLLFGSVIFLIVEITLTSNSLEVMGQSDLEKAKDILRAATNATANATADAMKKAEDLLSSGTREFTVSTYDDPRYSVLDTNSFGNIIFDVWKDKDGAKITDNLGQLNIGDEPASSFSYSQLGKEHMVVALIHNNVGYVFEYDTLKENFEKDFDTMMHFIGTLRLS